MRPALYYVTMPPGQMRAVLDAAAPRLPRGVAARPARHRRRRRLRRRGAAADAGAPHRPVRRAQAGGAAVPSHAGGGRPVRSRLEPAEAEALLGVEHYRRAEVGLDGAGVHRAPGRRRPWRPRNGRIPARPAALPLLRHASSTSWTTRPSCATARSVTLGRARLPVLRVSRHRRHPGAHRRRRHARGHARDGGRAQGGGAGDAARPRRRGRRGACTRCCRAAPPPTARRSRSSAPTRRAPTSSIGSPIPPSCWPRRSCARSAPAARRTGARDRSVRRLGPPDARARGEPSARAGRRRRRVLLEAVAGATLHRARAARRSAATPTIRCLSRADRSRLVVLSDAFPYIWHKRLLAGEMMRLAGDRGTIVMPHLHSSLGFNFSAGMTLTPAAYRDLFAPAQPRLFRDSDLLERHPRPHRRSICRATSRPSRPATSRRSRWSPARDAGRLPHAPAARSGRARRRAAHQPALPRRAARRDRRTLTLTFPDAGVRRGVRRRPPLPARVADARRRSAAAADAGAVRRPPTPTCAAGASCSTRRHATASVTRPANGS